MRRLKKAIIASMSELGKALIEAMESPDDWTVGPHYATHDPSSTKWWIANSGFFFGPYQMGDEAKLGLVERHILYWMMRRMVIAPKARKKRREIAEMLTSRLSINQDRPQDT